MQNNDFLMGFTYDDVLLEPRFSDVVRSEVDLSTQVTKKIKIAIPILAAAMDTVSGAEMAIALGKLGGLAVLHRNCTVQQQLLMLKKIKSHKLLAAASVGPHDIARAVALDKAGVDIVVIDCAHAHNKKIIADAKKIKKNVKAQLMIGNLATKEAASEFVKFADAIKVGIGPGSICTTRVVAGIGVPQLSAVLAVVAVAKKHKIPIVADGGIKYSGDIVKALAAGASTVMLGSMLAGTKESPGKIIKKNGQTFKEYRGMGSLGAMQKGQSSDRYFQKGNTKYVPEGVEGIIPYKGKVEDVIFNMVGGLKSGMGYIGAKNLAQLALRARFIRISTASLKESHPHTISINKKAPNY
ncbi:MAG: IMP dehydrogenase [Patescibacteria group bacterium]|jgi:IMP dehydrogenase